MATVTSKLQCPLYCPGPHDGGVEGGGTSGRKKGERALITKALEHGYTLESLGKLCFKKYRFRGLILRDSDLIDLRFHPGITNRKFPCSPLKILMHSQRCSSPYYIILKHRTHCPQNHARPVSLGLMSEQTHRIGEPAGTPGGRCCRGAVGHRPGSSAQKAPGKCFQGSVSGRVILLNIWFALVLLACRIL